MNPITKFRLALARMLVPDYLRPTEEEAQLIKSLLVGEVRKTRHIEDSDFFHQQAAIIQVQLDLETWGLAPGCALRSIGAAVTMPYDVHQLAGKMFKVNITRESCEAVGLTMDPETVKWWEKQSDEAKAAAMVDAIPLKDALLQLNYWLTGLANSAANSGYMLEFGIKVGQNPPVHVFGNGAVMDVSLIQAAIAAVKMETVWPWWGVGDTRTVVSLGRFIGLDDRRIKRQGVLHEASSDALYDGSRTASVQRAIIALAKTGIAILP